MKNLILNSLIDQKAIFGDDLYQEIEVPDFSPAEILLKVDPVIQSVQDEEIVESKSSFNSTSLDELYREVKDCKKCELSETRTKFVFGSGNQNADIMLIGEAPGADEDKQGLPFVGRAGQLLTDILKAIKFERDDVYIANILKCRPPHNRDPKFEEMETCIPILQKQVELIKPKLILCLGRIAAQGLLNNKLSLTKMRGQVFEYNNVKVMVTYHPAALLRNPGWKRATWEDVQKFKKLYDDMSG